MLLSSTCDKGSQAKSLLASFIDTQNIEETLFDAISVVAAFSAFPGVQMGDQLQNSLPIFFFGGLRSEGFWIQPKHLISKWHFSSIAQSKHSAILGCFYPREAQMDSFNSAIVKA